jgi:hypothetical protein
MILLPCSILQQIEHLTITRRPPPLRQPLRASAGRNRERQSHHRDPHVALNLAILFLASKTHWSDADVNHLAALARELDGNLAGVSPLFPFFCRPFDLDLIDQINSLNEPVPANLSHQIIIRSNGLK